MRRLLTSAVVAWARADEALRRAQQAGRLSMGAFLSRALTLEERESLVAPLYGATWRTAIDTLHPWESEWFATALPPAPAMILVGGAGSGREVAALVALGYTVDALEPAEELLPALRAAGARQCWTAGYREMIAGLDGLMGPYDACLLGWGSVHHVLDVQVRRAIWRTADTLTPQGPLLASFWLADGDGPLRAAPGGRVVAGARHIGGLVGGLRQVEATEGEIFDPRFGFARPLSRAEVVESAADLKREVRWSAPGAVYPHVTLILADRRTLS
ncbi:MAG: hypothetical protein ACE366_02135 [Bradymonadia bacterium]